ncbi:ATP-binding cassette domain-containing protein [Pseudonocardia oroxyli]|uniref:ABC-2 type transport system ATP-binding protein n=1 Tax=Pseudonocardia oroxyli TaxID=366584 RepID=A0A1G7GQ28_PSEOR|nr:ATP-binding cassette domain-containing protein [Pseudonocardia oroxyli]SDE90265.1 ABC-2 type transport system ATP-binding protein [Pseudonocardia oroxyli]
MIHTDALARTFTVGKERVEAVRGIDLDVAEGELVAFLGPNGAGKSTTLRMLTSLLPPTSGTAQVAGIDVVAEPAEVRRRIGYIGQKDGAGHNYRVWDELLMQGRFYGMSKADAVASGSELLASLDLEGLRTRKVSSLSGGQKRRLDIALGLIHKPGLLFLDEPSTGMDPQNRANLWEHILRIREERGTTILLTTHYLDEADQMAERVVIVDHGRIIADDTADALKRKQAGDRLTVVVRPDQADTAQTLLATEGAEPASRPDADGVALSVRVEAASHAMPGVLERLRAAGVDVVAASAHRPTLDDVFLNLTGRSLREGE